MVRVRQCIAVLSALIATLPAGCGSRNPATYAVTGTITYQGKPIEGASVMFIPSNGRPASGLTDAEGRFTLRTFKDGDGVIGGENIVCVSKTISDPSDKTQDPMLKKTRSLLPARYATPTTSPLKATVSATGPNEFTFALSDGSASVGK